jgi:hypothetical protein
MEPALPAKKGTPDTIALARAKWEEHGWPEVAEGMAPAVVSVTAGAGA